MILKLTTRIVVFVSLLVPSFSYASEVTVHLLNVLPFPGEQSFGGWDRAYELIPATDLAVEQINNRTDILPGYKLKTIDIDSESCGISVVSKGLANTYANFIDERLLIGGVVGLFCSTVTESIAPLASPSFPFLDYVHVAGSTSVQHRNISEYPRLHHVISSTEIYNDAVLEMMKKFEWTNMGLVYESLSINYIAGALDFSNKIKAVSNLSLTTSYPLSQDNLGQLFDVLRTERARTVFVALTPQEAAAVLCAAFQEKLTSGLVLILQERNVEDLLRSARQEAKITCTDEQMILAMEGIFLLNYRLEVEPETELESGQIYEEYYDEYLQRLGTIEEEVGMPLQTDNTYANVAYDEVWALALALNNSISDLREANLTLEDNRKLDKRSQFAEIVQGHLDVLDFQGAAGAVKFTAKRETKTSIYIFRVSNGSASKVAFYDAVHGLVRILEGFDVPMDMFETQYNVLPAWLEYTSYVIVAIIESTIIFLCILHFAYRNRPEVKATSQFLSMVMFAGCFILAEATLFRTLSRVLINLDETSYKVICNFEVWSGSTGLNLILGTLFVRLLRIQHVFKAITKTSKYWGDRYLFLGILALCSGAIVILSIWTAVDPIRKFRSEIYVPDLDPPHYEVTFRCSSDNLSLWLPVAFAYSGLLLCCVLCLAIKTRHIKKTNFKDTKKINAYLFAVTFAIAITLPVWFILEYRVESRIGAHIAITLMFLSTVVLCLVLIFVPKVVPLLPCFPERLKRKSVRDYNMKVKTSSVENLTVMKVTTV